MKHPLTKDKLDKSGFMNFVGIAEARVTRNVLDAAPETIEITHYVVLDGRTLKVWQILEAIGITFRSMVSISNDYLGMRRLSSSWLSRLLIIDNKYNRNGNFKRALKQCGLSQPVCVN